jgi:uncharacterized C2H2 Zn-finger protein
MERENLINNWKCPDCGGVLKRRKATSISEWFKKWMDICDWRECTKCGKIHRNSLDALILHTSA